MTPRMVKTSIDQQAAAMEQDLNAGEYVLLSVSDTGQGMSPEVAARAFDPFFTTKPIGQGTGLGLSQLYGFVKQSGGHARIHSEEGRGTTVRIYLPRCAEERDGEVAPGPIAETPTAPRRETVLVVEDEPLVRTLVVQTLEEAGFGVIEAGDPQEALRLLKLNDADAAVRGAGRRATGLRTSLVRHVRHGEARDDDGNRHRIRVDESPRLYRD